MKIINSLIEKRENLLNIASNFIDEKRESILTKKRIRDIILPALFCFSSLTLFVLPEKIIDFFNIYYGVFFEIMKFLDGISFFTLFTFILFMFFKLNVIDDFSSTYFENKKMADLIKEKKLEEFIKYSKGLSHFKKSEIKNLYNDKIESFMLNKDDIKDIMDLVRKTQVTEMSLDRLLKKYVNEEGFSLMNAVLFINEIIEEENLMVKAKSKEKILECIRSI